VKHPALGRTRTIRREILAGRKVRVDAEDADLPRCDFDPLYWERASYRALDLDGGNEIPAIVELCSRCARRMGLLW